MLFELSVEPLSTITISIFSSENSFISKFSFSNNFSKFSSSLKHGIIKLIISIFII